MYVKDVALNFNKYILFYAALALLRRSIRLIFGKLMLVCYSMTPSFLLKLVKAGVLSKFKFDSMLQEVKKGYHANVPLSE